MTNVHDYYHVSDVLVQGPNGPIAVVTRVIQSHPDRDSSTSRLETVREELGQLEEREKQLQEKLELRKKQFHLLVSSIHQMQDLLAEAEDENTQKTGPKSPEDSMEVEGIED